MKQNNEIKIYTPQLECELLKKRNSILRLLCWVLIGVWVVCKAVTMLDFVEYYRPSVAFSFAMWLMVLAVCGLVIADLVQQQTLRKMKRSALIVEGDTVTLLTADIDNSINTCDTLIGSTMVSAKGGINNEDMLGFGLSNNKREKSVTAFTNAVNLMQDEKYVLEKYRSEYGNVTAVHRYDCRLEKSDRRNMVIACAKEKGGQQLWWTLPNVFGDVVI